MSYTATMENICDSTGTAILANASGDNTNCSSKTTLGIPENGTEMGIWSKCDNSSKRNSYIVCRICSIEKTSLEYPYINKRKPSTCRKCDNLKKLKQAHTPEAKKKKAERGAAWRKKFPEYSKAYRNKNKERIANNHTVWIEKNREHRSDVGRAYRAKNSEHIKNIKKVWSKANRKRLNSQELERRRNNHDVYLAKILRSRMHCAMVSGYKAGSSVADLGCSIPEFRAYLESRFLPNMSWENYGRTGWHIDHIVPLSSFDLTNPEQFKIAAHHTNMQPLWAIDNLIKYNKIPQMPTKGI